MTTQQAESKQHNEYILSLHQPLCNLVKEETDLRLKYLILVVNHAVDYLADVITLRRVDCNAPIDLEHYKINEDIYYNYLSIASETIRFKCEKGINFSRFKKKVDQKTIWNSLKNYWFRIVPDIITKSLWVPLLAEIANFYYNLANYCSGYASNLSGLIIQRFLHKNFLRLLLETKCQINLFSNPSGSIIQTSCWKHEPFHKIITDCFDENKSYHFMKWMNKKQDGGKRISAPKYVSKYVKSHAQSQYKLFLESIGITHKYNQYNVHQMEVSAVVLFNNNNTLSRLRHEEHKRNDDESNVNQWYASAPSNTTFYPGDQTGATGASCRCLQCAQRCTQCINAYNHNYQPQYQCINNNCNDNHNQNINIYQTQLQHQQQQQQQSNNNSSYGQTQM